MVNIDHPVCSRQRKIRNAQHGRFLMLIVFPVLLLAAQSARSAPAAGDAAAGAQIIDGHCNVWTATQNPQQLAGA